MMNEQFANYFVVNCFVQWHLLINLQDLVQETEIILSFLVYAVITTRKKKYQIEW